MEKKSNHLSEIDGIRGWAALVVVLFHCFSEMLKNVVPEVTSNMLAPAFAGNYAVLIFFVLSGDALSASFHKSGSQSSVDRLLVRRYFRLTIPIFMSCCLTYFIIKLGVDFHKRAAVILNRNDWLGEFLDFNVSLFFLIKYSLMNVYTSHTRTESLNPFLWTMSIEIIGSMIVFLYCYAWERLKRPAILCLVLAIILSAMGSFYSLFFGGIYLGYLRKNGFLEKFKKENLYQFLSLLFLIFVIFLKTLPTLAYESSIFKPAIYLSAIIFVLCLYTSRPILRLMQGRLSVFMGEISFSLYLVHFQIIISLMSWLISTGSHGELSKSKYIAIATLTVLTSILAACFFRYIEKRILEFLDPYVLKALK